MALKVKAVERKIKFSKNENDPGVYRYVMSPELYIALSQAKVIREAALRSGVSQGVMKACWDAAGEVIKAWATEGHSPTQDLKDELADTAIQITCYDRNGEIVKRVTSADAGTVEDPEGDSNGTDSQGGSSTGSETAGGGSDNTGGDPQNPGDGDDGLDQD